MKKIIEKNIVGELGDDRSESTACWDGISLSILC